MRQTSWWIVVVVAIAALGFWALRSGDPAQSATTQGGPATVEHIDGSELSKVTLTEHAAQRIGLQVGDVSEQQVDGVMRKVIPFSAIFYDSMGNAWAYTNPEGLSYIRAPLTIERIEGDVAILTEGPEVGTKVVSVGAALLYGAEHGVGH